MAQVFISSGQKTKIERKITEKIARILKKEFGLIPYTAFRRQGVNDITKIFDELKKSDYYLFIDFYREEPIAFSLFTHQELALAREHQFEEILAYQAKAFDNHDKKPGGVLSIIQVNPQYFLNAKDLVEKIQADVKSRGWNSAYSRNLVAANIEITGPWSYGDHTGQSYAHVCQIKIENRRKDIAALNVICLLDFVEDPKGNKIYFGDRTPLKWAGLLQAYENTILPGDYGVVDLFAEGMDKPGIFLHSKRDAIPRAPVLKRNGKYKFFYKVYSSQFPVLEFAVDVNYHWLPPLTRKPQSHAIVKLKQKVSGVQQG